MFLNANPLSGGIGLPQNKAGQNLRSSQVRLTRTQWSPREDQILLRNVEKYGPLNWAAIADALPKRTGKQCRERWANHLSPWLDKGQWTLEEDWTLTHCHAAFGNAWSHMRSFLPTRSANSIKNRWAWLVRQTRPSAEKARVAPRPSENERVRAECVERPRVSGRGTRVERESKVEEPVDDPGEFFWI